VTCQTIDFPYCFPYTYVCRPSASCRLSGLCIQRTTACQTAAMAAFFRLVIFG
jgi:transposase